MQELCSSWYAFINSRYGRLCKDALIDELVANWDEHVTSQRRDHSDVRDCCVNAVGDHFVCFRKEEADGFRDWLFTQPVDTVMSVAAYHADRQQ